MKEEIKEILKRIVSEDGVDVSVTVSIPDDASHGDYTTNVAMLLAKQLKKVPLSIAEGIAEKFKVQSSPPEADQPLAENVKYQMSKDKQNAIEDALLNVNKDETLYVLPTYTAMLEIRKILTGKEIL